MKNLIIVSFIALSIISCKRSKKNEKENESETITKITVTLNTGGVANTYSYSDADGPGGNNPIIDTVFLSSNSNYTSTIKFIDETKQPAEDLTQEINEESDAHQVFYESNSAELKIIYLDKDKNAAPIGINTAWSTLNKASGNLKIILKHQPDGKTGNTASGETDVEIVFPLVIK